MGRKSRWDELRLYLRPVRYWQPSPREAPSRQLDPLSLYPIDITPRIEESFYDRFDASGVPLRDYGGTVGCQYNPTTVAAYALAQLDLFLRGGPKEHQELFLTQAQWFRDSAVRRTDGAVVWEYRFDWLHGLKAPWISAMAQGEGISVLCRAHLVTKDPVWLDLALAATRVFVQPVAAGGVTALLEGRWPVYQESPSQPPSHILNGFIYSLFGLDDLERLTGDAVAGKLLADGLESLRQRLERWDLGYWSRYDLYQSDKPNPASLTYHQLHVAQLQALAWRFQDSEFQHWAQRWAAYERQPVNRLRALGVKAWHKLTRY